MEKSCIAKMANLINYSARVTFSVYYACNCISLAFHTLLVFIKIKTIQHEFTSYVWKIFPVCKMWNLSFSYFLVFI